MLLTAAPAAAQTCIKTPSCTDLGYTKTAADCAGKTVLKCPLDNTQVYCPGYEETLRTYKVGDTYVNANGIGVGTVVKVDNDGQHGIVVSGSAYAGTASEVSQYCMSKTSGGLEWGLITKATADLYGDRCSGCEFYLTASGCCQICSSSVSGNCYSPSDSYYTKCSGGLCQANF